MISTSVVFFCLLLVGACSTLPPSTTPGFSPRAANQQQKCNVGSNAWPKLWLDVSILIDNSLGLNIMDFTAMKNKIKQIWQSGSGGPVVGQEVGKTRVGVISFNSLPRVIARLDQLHSNTELTNAIDTITQSRSPTVDSASALKAAADLLRPLSPGSRPNAPNVIIVYTAKWDGNNGCSVAQSIMRNTVIIVVAFKDPNQSPLNIPSCVYWPGELYAPNAAMDISLLESLSYVNCDCPGRYLPDNNGRTEQEKSVRTLLDQWYQFWLPRTDGKYYLRDKWGECVHQSFYALPHDLAQESCHRSDAHLPNEFSMEKHTFLINMAQAGNFISQWNGLQYDPATKKWYWDNFDQTINQPTRTLVMPGDFAFWDTNQPNTEDNKYCVKDSPAIGLPGFRWTSSKCTGLFVDRLQFFCQKPACDAVNYCSSA